MRKRILVVEAGRGIAALEVFLHHICEIFGLHTIAPWNFLLKPFLFGHEAVIVFFVLSGFSIHYSHGHKSLDTLNRISYFYFLRLLRLQPILLMGLLITAGISVGGAILGNLRYTAQLDGDEFWSSVVGAFFFFNGGITAPVSTNIPLWSLPYEIIYYLLYPLFLLVFSQYRLKGVLLFSVGLSTVAILYNVVNSAHHIMTIISLYGIWAIGGILAEFKRYEQALRIQYALLMSGIALFITLRIFLRDSGLTVVNDYLFAICVYLGAIIYQHRTELKATTPTMVTCFSALAFLVVMMLALGPDFWRYNGNWQLLMVKSAVIVFVFGLIVAICTSAQISHWLNKVVVLFYPTGKISYALYVIHFPVLIGAKEFLGNLLPTLLIILICLIVIPAISWLIESVLYPVIRSSILQLIARRQKSF